LIFLDVRSTPEEKRSELQQEGVFYFDTYVGAAKIAFAHKLISKSGLLRIIQSSKEDFLEIKFKNNQQREARLVDINNDISSINQLFPEDEKIELCI
jgi:hypothetical protein